mmetsp:Transcript_2549/g.6126  ORF Transcript_2549/g.6126 Transcript_2549/m.6126 type:complete len:268 (-) Transcript_2549:199-1002(-)|eukprot:CAMPEP_0116103040 /NCGR_PEP_ID=MMETSP0327-20121206/13672_1 /TAXON_ID=44447 /ORGANISM="Pseudo-nitzschia delicatissima, Strain B596" /LENGTH=267 /DNA_ID=CAMNT_0003595123 /DNA_START=51 /DNA_END=854 /DNA_ORIENTATION=-
MAMASNGRKKATSATRERRNDQYPSSMPMSDDEISGNDANVSGDYGIILVKKYRKLRSSSFVHEEPRTMPNHRGIRPTANKTNQAPERFVDVLAAALCGVCVSERYAVHEEPSTASTTVSDDSSEQSSIGDMTRPNAILLRQNRFKEEAETKQLEESIVTDVSFLTDGSPTDLEVRDVDEEMPSPSKNRAHVLPAFRKPPAMRKTQKARTMPSDLSKHTRKNPVWKEKMGDVFKKPYNEKKRKASSSRRKKNRFPLNQDRPERKRLV